MTVLFRIRPATPNVGNAAIAHATDALLRAVFGPELSIVDLPALADEAGIGGLTARQVYDINQAADGVVIGGGNLFENGQLTIDSRALDALRAPLLLIGLSHGRVQGRNGALSDRTDAMPPEAIRQLTQKAVASLVRDHASQRILQSLAAEGTEVGGCPTLFLPADPGESTDDGRVLISLRNPGRMSVPPAIQWRVAEDLRRLITALEREYGNSVHVASHDYLDIEFARGFPEARFVHFSDPVPFLDALRRCRLSVTYRLHAFLPCVAFGTPSVHLSYDERGREAVATAGMGEWDVDLLRETDVVETVMGRCHDLARYAELRAAALPGLAELLATTMDGLRRFAGAVERWSDRPSRP